MDKAKRQKRFLQKARNLNRKVKLRKLSSLSGVPGMPDRQPHRLAEAPVFNCGNSNCVMCGNPRKFFGELTIQEQKHREVCAEYSDRVLAREQDLEE